MAGHILILDPSESSSGSIRELMPARGFEVRTADTAEDALRIFTELRPEIVLIDPEFGGGTGLELIKRLRSVPDERRTIVLAIGDFPEQSQTQAALDAGCRGCISRPIDPQTFPGLIEKYLGQNDEPTPGAMSVDFNQDPEFVELQEEFIGEGMRQLEELIRSLDTGLDLKTARVAAHRWAGSGGSVGYPEVSRIAREIEMAAQNDTGDRHSLLRELLNTLQGLFAKAKQDLARKPDASVASEGVSFSALAQTLAGKRFALSGFPQEDNIRLARVIERYQAFSRTLVPGALTDEEMTRSLDAVLLHAVGCSALPQWTRALLIIGPEKDVMEFQAVRDGAAEFLISPWTEHGLVVRLYRALQRASEAAQQTGAPNYGKRRVLVVDDDSTIRELVRKTVQRAGLECRVAADGNQALEFARTWHPEIAIVDIEMPGKNGFDVLSSLRADPITFDIPVILLTACQRDEDVIRGRELGAADYVVKPFVPAMLMARVRKLLRKEVRRILLGRPGSGGVLYT